MTLSPLHIGDRTATIPIVQGGMGIGVSRSGLAAAVANCGGVGVISGVNIGFDEEGFEENPKEANIRALRKHIRQAKQLSPDGVIGLNLLAVISDYDDYVAVAVEEDIDLIISGAGLPLSLPKRVEGSRTAIAPIVSSGKAAHLIAKTWDKKYGRVPDLVIVEGPEAGGHLGFSTEQLEENEQSEKYELKSLLFDVLAALKPFEEKYGKKIPVIGAGGIFDGADIQACLASGAAGVQMATRFVATEECDADLRFKLEFVRAKPEDLQLV
ncbi:MAG: NAD(P)H-dependent flavin oxidoreductase, partial [Bacteroidota bacterium]